MKAKKDYTRFTIKFNSNDPIHRMAIHLLNGIIRKKADLIAKSLVFHARQEADILKALMAAEKFNNPDNATKAKKDCTRLTIMFDPDDPIHQMAINRLNGNTRKKADLIAKALVFYTYYETNELGTLVITEKSSNSDSPIERMTVSEATFVLRLTLSP